jgi:hypothetical protein
VRLAEEQARELRKHPLKEALLLADLETRNQMREATLGLIALLEAGKSVAEARPGATTTAGLLPAA